MVWGFAGEETRTMVWVSFSLQIYSTFEFWRLKFSVVWVLGLIGFPHFMGMGVVPAPSRNMAGSRACSRTTSDPAGSHKVLRFPKRSWSKCRRTQKQKMANASPQKSAKECQRAAKERTKVLSHKDGKRPGPGLKQIYSLDGGNSALVTGC